MSKRERPKAKKDVRPMFYVYTEGEKTEPNYIEGYIKDFLNAAGHFGKIIFVEKPTGNEPENLVTAAKAVEEDQVWIVFDHDNRGKKLPEIFAKAQKKGINIAFSSISFETWILMHFTDSTKAYDSCDKIIKTLNGYFNGNYKKGVTNLFRLSAGENSERLVSAKTNAAKLCKYAEANNPEKNIWEYGAYTNIHVLLEAIEQFLEKK